MDPIKLTRRLIDIESISGNEGAVGAELYEELCRLGYAAHKMPVAHERFNVVATIVLIWYMILSRSTPVLRRARFERRLFRDVLGVGLLSAVGTAQFNLTVLLVTGAVGVFGADALAGYGIASRLDYLLIPLLFGLGTAVVTMVGTNVGAGAVARARRIAWAGAENSTDGFEEALRRWFIPALDDGSMVRAALFDQHRKPSISATPSARASVASCSLRDTAFALSLLLQRS